MNKLQGLALAVAVAVALGAIVFWPATSVAPQAPVAHVEAPEEEEEEGIEPEPESEPEPEPKPAPRSAAVERTGRAAHAAPERRGHKRLGFGRSKPKH